jgi:hypothetical protein
MKKVVKNSSNEVADKKNHLVVEFKLVFLIALEAKIILFHLERMEIIMASYGLESTFHHTLTFSSFFNLPQFTTPSKFDLGITQ